MPTYVYVSLQGDDKILRFVMDPADGRLAQRHEIEVSGGPAPLALDPERRRMYVGRRSGAPHVELRDRPSTRAISR